MTSQEFITWLKGVVSASNEYAPTPQQWDLIKDELSKVSDKPTVPPYDDSLSYFSWVSTTMNKQSSEDKKLLND